MVILNTVLGVLLVIIFFAACAVIVREQTAFIRGTRKPRWWLAFAAFVVLAIDIPLTVFTTARGVLTLVLGIVVVLLGVLVLVLALRVRGLTYSRGVNVLFAAGVITAGLAVVGLGLPALTGPHCGAGLHCYSGLSGSTVRGLQP